MYLNTSNRISTTLLLFFLSITLFACDDDLNEDIGKKKYDVDSNLAPYLDRFLIEAEKRGHTFDLKNDGLIMEFADLEEPTIGLCYYKANPIKVQIDRTYWGETTQSKNQENLREDVVFHELAHGLLQRLHKNETLPTTEWASVMCGGDVVDDRGWWVNFNGFRKEYYLDELFDPDAPAPEWSKPVVFDGYEGDLFSSADYSEYIDSQLYSNGSLIDEVKDGKRVISTTSRTNDLYPIQYFPDTEDFYLELKMSLSTANDVAYSGVFAAYSETGQYNFFSINSNNRSYLVNSDCEYPFVELLLGNKYLAGRENKVGIERRGDDLFFYLNDQLVYQNDYSIAGYDMIGVLVPAGGSVTISNYKAYVSGNGLRFGKIRESQPRVVGTRGEIKMRGRIAVSSDL